MKKKAFALTILLLCALVCLPACSPKPVWKNAPSVGDEVTAGDQVILEPVNYGKVTLEGSKSVEFKFTCKPAAGEIPGYKRALAIISADSANSTLMRRSYGFTDWAKGAGKADVTYTLSNAPSGNMTYSGDGIVYFYLLDANDKCISNIVEWEVTFK